MIKRVFVEVHMTKDGYMVDLQDIDFKTKEVKQQIAVTFGADQMDYLMACWQEFKNGTNKKNYRLFGNYIDTPLDMPESAHQLDYQKYMRMDEDEKSKQ